MSDIEPYFPKLAKWDGTPRLDAWLSSTNAHRRGPRDPSLRHGRVLSFTSLAILGGFYE